jgi:hypothetical protein
MNEMPEPEWMRKLFDREEEPRVIGESITVIMVLLKVARAAKNLRKNRALEAWPEVVELEKALEELPDELLE